MVPVEIDHIVCFEIKGLIPKAFDKIVVDKPLNVMGASRRAENLDWLAQSDLGVLANPITTRAGALSNPIKVPHRLSCKRILHLRARHEKPPKQAEFGSKTEPVPFTMPIGRTAILR